MAAPRLSSDVACRVAKLRVAPHLHKVVLRLVFLAFANLGFIVDVKIYNLHGGGVSLVGRKLLPIIHSYVPLLVLFCKGFS